MSDLLFFFLYFAGILTLALFIHNAIITIMSNNRNQENNVSISKLFEFLIWMLRTMSVVNTYYSVLLINYQY